MTDKEFFFEYTIKVPVPGTNEKTEIGNQAVVKAKDSVEGRRKLISKEMRRGNSVTQIEEM